MKQKIIALISVILFTSAFFSCEDEYADWKKRGEAFLVANKTDTDVVVTNSGLQYKVLVNSESIERPQAASIVQIKYNFSFFDGTVYDEKTSYNFLVSGLLSGIQEGVLKMRLGSKWRLYIPYNLAYGADGMKDSAGKYLVPPYTVMVCDIEIIGIY